MFDGFFTLILIAVGMAAAAATSVTVVFGPFMLAGWLRRRRHQAVLRRIAEGTER